jgi:hypothetical protein
MNAPPDLLAGAEGILNDIPMKLNAPIQGVGLAGIMKDQEERATSIANYW